MSSEKQDSLQTIVASVCMTFTTAVLTISPAPKVNVMYRKLKHILNNKLLAIYLALDYNFTCNGNILLVLQYEHDRFKKRGVIVNLESYKKPGHNFTIIHSLVNSLVIFTVELLQFSVLTVTLMVRS